MQVAFAHGFLRGRIEVLWVSANSDSPLSKHAVPGALGRTTDWAFRHCGVRENSIAQRGVRQLAHHRRLHDRHDSARMRTHRCEAKDFIAIVAAERFHQAARFGERPGAKHGLHGQLRHAVLAARRHRFVFVESRSCNFPDR